MIRAKTHGAILLTAAGLVCLGVPQPAAAVSPIRLSGSITGQVTDPGGIPQMGATVLLFNRFDRLAQKVFTDEKGGFVFAGLMPDIYSVRVTLATFVPAIRGHILVQPGVRSVLNVSLANLFSSIQLVYPSADQHGLMSDDWKWALRSASETRPILRYLPGRSLANTGTSTAVFSDTRGMLRLSAGESDLASTAWGEGDLGTTFALATSLYGKNQLQFSGKLGYGPASGTPSAAFRTSFSRNAGGGSPEVSLTMRQLYLPERAATALGGGDAGMPALRSMSVNFEDRTQLSDTLTLHYGFSLDSVSFVERLNYFSPFARLTYDLGDDSKIELTYTSGNSRPDLGMPANAANMEFQRDLNTLAMFPLVSLVRGRARVQRGENFEAAYTRKVGSSRSVQVTAYRESVSNAALTMSDPDGLFVSGDLLPDLYSGTAIFNAGDYESLGYTAAVTQEMGPNVSMTLMAGSTGALMADSGKLESDSPDELRAMIRSGRRHSATLRANATLPWSGTHLIGSYQWADHRSVAPTRLYSTQSMRPDPGFNLYIRQPVPGWSLLPWRMEITADLRNLLAQGYLPLPAAGGRRILLMQTPRSFRGGLSFIF